MSGRSRWRPTPRPSSPAPRSASCSPRWRRSRRPGQRRGTGLAKDSLSRSLPAAFTTASDTAAAVGGLYRHDLPPDYYRSCRRRSPPIDAGTCKRWRAPTCGRPDEDHRGRGPGAARPPARRGRAGSRRLPHPGRSTHRPGMTAGPSEESGALSSKVCLTGHQRFTGAARHRSRHPGAGQRSARPRPALSHRHLGRPWRHDGGRALGLQHAVQPRPSPAAHRSPPWWPTMSNSAFLAASTSTSTLGGPPEPRQRSTAPAGSAAPPRPGRTPGRPGCPATGPFRRRPTTGSMIELDAVLVDGPHDGSYLAPRGAGSEQRRRTSPLGPFDSGLSAREGQSASCRYGLMPADHRSSRSPWLMIPGAALLHGSA